MVIPSYISPPFWGVRDRLGFPRPDKSCPEAQGKWEDGIDYYHFLDAYEPGESALDCCT